MSYSWQSNAIQFPRLLAEISAIGLTPEQLQELSLNTGLSESEIKDVFERAEQEFRVLKDGILMAAIARNAGDNNLANAGGHHESPLD